MCVYVRVGLCVHPREKNGENDGDCSFGRMGNGEPFSVCQFFPKVSQFSRKVCQNFQVLSLFAKICHFCVTFFQKCAKGKIYVTFIVINRDKLWVFLILSHQKV